MDPLVCVECKKLCDLVMSKARPESSEWYCGDCHKSYPVEGLTKPVYQPVR